MKITKLFCCVFVGYILGTTIIVAEDATNTLSQTNAVTQMSEKQIEAAADDIVVKNKIKFGGERRQ